MLSPLTSRQKLLYAIFASLLFAICGSSVDASDTVSYTYDALGRLTAVSDSVNGPRSYSYDSAGNRKSVTVGVGASSSSSSSSAPSAPPAPTGLFSTQNSMCSWQASWSPSLGATSYNFRDVSGNHELTVTATQVVYGFSSCSITPSSEKPKWVQACNASGCSAKSNFP